MKSYRSMTRSVLIAIAIIALSIDCFVVADGEDFSSATKSSLNFAELFARSDVEYIRSYVPVRLPRLRSMPHEDDDDDDDDDDDAVVQLVLEFAVRDGRRRRFPISLRPIVGVVSSTTNVSTVSWHDGRRPFNVTRLANRWRRYEGRLDDDPHSLVSGHVVQGLFTGFLNTNNETYFVEPASDYFPATHRKKFNAILYKASDVYVCPQKSSPSSTDCGDSTYAVNGSSLRRVHSLPAGFYRHMLSFGADIGSRRVMRRREAEASKMKSTAYLCDLRIIADFRWYRYVAYRNTTYGTELVESLLRRVDQMFRALDVDGDGRPDNIGFVMRDMDIYIDPVLPIYDTVDDGDNDWDPKRFFDEFRAYNFDGVCAGLLFTYRRLSFDHRHNVPTIPKTNIVSLEQGICSRYMPPDGPVGLLADYGIYVANALPVNFMSQNQVASASSIVVETAHQLGHLFGARDDAETDDPRCRPIADVSRNYLMAYPLVSADVERNFRWSPCSHVAFETFLHGLEIQGRSCLKPCLGTSCLRDRWGAVGDPRWARQNPTSEAAVTTATAKNVDETTLVTTAAAAADATTPKADATTPVGDATTPKGDATTPKGDATTPKGDATTPKGDATTPKGDATTPKGDATTPKGDATTPKGDATTDNSTGAADDSTSAAPVGETSEPSTEDSNGGDANNISPPFLRCNALNVVLAAVFVTFVLQ